MRAISDAVDESLESSSWDIVKEHLYSPDEEVVIEEPKSKVLPRNMNGKQWKANLYWECFDYNADFQRAGFIHFWRRQQFCPKSMRSILFRLENI